MKSICVFCGSSSGNNEIYKTKAKKFGEHLAKKGYKLVYGGGKVGLMGIIADSVLNAGGSVTGVIPKDLMDKEVGHDGLTEMFIVNGMQERKSMLSKLADVFVALPGGFGTLDELFEVLTWSQLGIINKPCAILNINGYFDHLIKLLEHTVEEKFLNKKHLNNLIVETDEDKLLDRINNYNPEISVKWIEALKERK